MHQNNIPSLLASRPCSWLLVVDEHASLIRLMRQHPLPKHANLKAQDRNATGFECRKYLIRAGSTQCAIVVIPGFSPGHLLVEIANPKVQFLFPGNGQLLQGIKKNGFPPSFSPSTALSCLFVCSFFSDVHDVHRSFFCSLSLNRQRTFYTPALATLCIW